MNDGRVPARSQHTACVEAHALFCSHFRRSHHPSQVSDRLIDGTAISLAFRYPRFLEHNMGCIRTRRRRKYCPLRTSFLPCEVRSCLSKVQVAVVQPFDFFRTSWQAFRADTRSVAVPFKFDAGGIVAARDEVFAFVTRPMGGPKLLNLFSSAQPWVLHQVITTDGPRSLWRGASCLKH